MAVLKAVFLLKAHLGKAAVKLAAADCSASVSCRNSSGVSAKERHTQQHHKYLLVTLTDGIADFSGVFFLLLVAREMVAIKSRFSTLRRLARNFSSQSSFEKPRFPALHPRFLPV